MPFDAGLFDIINALAGRWGWLDALGRGLAVYGLLGVLVLAVAPVWWPGLTRRGRYLGVLVAIGAACLLLYAAESYVTQHVLHHELRTRPFNARWATVLITPSSHLPFPAWPLAVACALCVPAMHLNPRFGWGMAGLCALLGLSLVFVGVNYPLDVLTGIFLGCTIGATVTACVYQRPRRRILLLLWPALALWGVVLLLTIRPSTAEEGGAPVARAQLPIPARVQRALQDDPTVAASVEAATNGRLYVAVVQLCLPDARVSLQTVTDRARRTVNTVMQTWPEIDLVTVTIAARFPRENGEKVGTLYTATVARKDYPRGGFAPGQRLPGKKFYAPQFYAQ